MNSAARVPSAIAANIVSSRAYAEWRQIHEDFAALRREAPLAVAQPEGYDPFWVIAKHADIMEVSRQPEIFNARGQRAGLTSRKQWSEMQAHKDSIRPVRSLVAMDPPEHMKFRLLTFADFAPKGLKALEADIRALARESVADMAARNGSCDFARDIALYYPLRVILPLLGLPRSDEERMLRLTQEFFNPNDPDLNQSGEAVDESAARTTADEVLRDFYGFFDDLTDSRRRNPTKDLASVIANGRIDGELMSHWDAASYYVTVLTAGHDTTSSSTAGAIWALAERPDQFARVKADPTLIPKLVDEAIRWTTPLLNFMRTATQDYQLRGQTVRKGDWLMLAYPSGNRDEDVFDDPMAFNVARAPNPHVSFGYGAHVCLGQHLARMEMRIFFEELFQRLETLELAGEPKRTVSKFIGGVKTATIRYRMS
ncbi:MAG: cytochrome P450 [Hyphomonadaceae bacterium]